MEGEDAMPDGTRLFVSQPKNRSFAEAALRSVEGARADEKRGKWRKIFFSPISFGVVLGFHGVFGG